MSSNTISFQCLACDADFEVGITSLLERPVALKCPHCNARPPAHRCHALAQALDDLLSAMAAIRSKVHFELSLDTEELPPPYGAGAGAASSEGSLTSDEDEDEGEDESGDEDEDEDEDFEFDDEDEEFDEDEDEDEDGDGDKYD